MKRIITILTIVSLVFVAGPARADIPHVISFQGKAVNKNTGEPLKGTYDITFSIYDSATGGTALWSETHNGTSQVQITNGIFSVALGSINPLNLPFDKQYYLGVKIGTDDEMAPRTTLTSVGYAYTAKHALSADRVTDQVIPSGVIVMWSGTIANIPEGWALCDGTNGTPDLRDRFIVGARQDEGGVAKTNITNTLTQSGGSVSITKDNLPPHTHSAGTLIADYGGAHSHSTNVFNHGSNMNAAVAAVGRYSSEITTDLGGAHSHSISGSTGSTGAGTPYTQPYYALAFIMKL